MLYYSGGEHLRHARVRAPPGQYLARKAMGPHAPKHQFSFKVSEM